MLNKPNKAFLDLFVVKGAELEELRHRDYAIYLPQEEWPENGEWTAVGNGPYVQGYIRAAQVVWESMEKVDQANTLLYPAVFLARQAVELALKEAIRKARTPPQETQKSGKDLLWSTHDLKLLAEWFKELYGEKLGSSWQAHHEFLLEFEKADPHGGFFRYCRDTEGRIFDMRDAGQCLTGLRVREPLHEAARIIQGVADL